ncbi:serine/threonine protein kinase [Limnoglobus roseus]|uniref:Serine/threonine protein kinase n=1 Tax=Limnoglobus roseus TaxID=2598579 RepID=A0A5C1APY5_9BACT|nr:serine/threonine-protein kinase [Limnoglobus roseus]QEL18928.1 serine/threonine protein kinase [Limnoglobus roseus]
MVTNDLGACEWFVWDLRRSGLIDRGQLDQIVSDFLKRNPRAEAPALAEYMVQQGSLTAFQAERILNGKTQGLVLGPYILQDAIGQGSMGQVYKATSKNDTTTYAVKVLPRRSMWNVRLARRQVRSFGQFQHAAVLPFVDVGTAGGLHYLVWPMAEGQTLETLIQQNGRLPVNQAALIGMQVAQGLSIAHQNNLFHGLVKPSNIMLGGDGQARLLDFGIGSLLVENEGESLVDTMSTANTLTSGLDCASPESILEPTNRTPAGDQYSLGCILYNCLTGHPPFPEGSAVEKMMAHQTKEPDAIKDFNPDVPDAVVEVVRRLMAKKPEDRYAGLDEVVESLEPFIGEQVSAPAEPAAVSSPAGLSGSRARLGSLGNGSPNMPTRMSTPVLTPPPSPSAFPSPGGSGMRSPAPSFPPAGPPKSNPAARASVPNFPPAPTPAQPVVPGRANLGQRPNLPTGGSNPGTKPLPAPVPMRSSQPAFPNRAALNLPGFDPGEVPLTPATTEPPPFADPSRQSMPGGWIPPDEDSSRGGAFGTLGIILAALLLAALVFLGATVMMK